MREHSHIDRFLLDNAAGGVGYVEDHQHLVEFLPKDDNGIGKFGVAATRVAV